MTVKSGTGANDGVDGASSASLDPNARVRDFFPAGASIKRKPSGNNVASATSLSSLSSSSNLTAQTNNNNGTTGALPPTAAAAAPPPTGRGRRVRTVYACAADHGSELSFEANQIIVNVRVSQEPGWLTGTLNGKEGLIPANYVEFLPDAAAT